MMWSRTWDTTVKHYFPHAAFAVAFLLVPFAMRDRRFWLEGDRSAWLVTVHDDRAVELTRYPTRRAVQATAAP